MSWYAEDQFEKAVKEIIKYRSINQSCIYSMAIDIAGEWISSDLRWKATIDLNMARGILNIKHLWTMVGGKPIRTNDMEPLLNRAGWTKYTPTSTIRCRYCHEIWGYDYIDPHMSVCPHRLEQMACYSCGHYIPHGQCELIHNWHMVIHASCHSTQRYR